MGDVTPVLISSMATIVVYALILAAVYKLFQLHTVMNEIRELLGDIKRNTSPDFGAPQNSKIPPPFAAAYESPDQLIRALSEADEAATRETPTHPQV